jgi:hypothetical protein
MDIVILLLLRILWRLLIFLLGVAVLFALVNILWPYSVTSRTTAFFALLLIYCLMAYLVIPALFRVYRILVQPHHIPLYAVTRDGWPADPVNIAVIARSEKSFIKAMHEAGWHKADKATLKTSVREAYSILFDRPYPTAPFSNLYLLGRPFDIGFQKPSSSSLSARARHHVRFWRIETLESNGPHKHTHVAFWHKHLKHLFGMDRHVWIGAAIDDTGPIGIRWRNGQLTHKNNPDTNAERDLIIADLSSAQLVRTTETIQAGDPFTFRGQTLGNRFLCDGTIKVVNLRRPAIAKLRPHK